jgi:hypothetical protein
MWLNEARQLARGEGRGGSDNGAAISAELLRSVIVPSQPK